jgi:hypothetical protein
MHTARRRALAALAAASAAAMLWSAAIAEAAGGGALLGTFEVAPGSCAGAVSGSYFRMILPTGDANGPFASNGDSVCTDQTYSPLLPGSDGGLVTGTHQPSPSPAFDGSGNGLAARITQPTPFFGVTFAASTEATDPQTGVDTEPPSISADGAGNLTGSLAAFGASWNKQSFNQGAPKPDGSYPGNSSKVTGAYDPASGAYSLTWRSQIVGGPFDNFTGVWHLEGTFRPAGTATPAASPGAANPTPAAGLPNSSAATVPAAAGGATVTTVADVAGPAVASADPAAGGSALAADMVSTDVTTESTGWQPPRWLVLAVATLGLAGAVGLVWLSRTEPKVAT